MPRVEWPEITEGAVADYLRSRVVEHLSPHPSTFTSGSMGMYHNDINMYHPWEKQIEGLQRAFEKLKPSFWTCAYCSRGNSFEDMGCNTCGAPIGRSVNYDDSS